jgi:osmotically-inducible protein OsmY
MKVWGVLATGLLLQAAGMRAWGAESEGEAAGQTQGAQSPAAAAAAEPGDEAPEQGTGEPTSSDQAAPSADSESPAAAAAAEPQPVAPAADSAPAVATPKRSGAGEDRRMAKEIQGIFAKDPDLKNNRINVTVDHCNTDEYSTNCYVTLAGAVDNQVERMKAEQVARVKGVVIIDNLLDLSEDAQEGVADGAVTAKVREQLLSDPTFKNAIISISTTNGVVRLVGTVPSETVRRQAGDKARNSRAVKRVENALRVEPAWRKSAVSQSPGVAAR